MGRNVVGGDVMVDGESRSPMVGQEENKATSDDCASESGMGGEKVATGAGTDGQDGAASEVEMEPEVLRRLFHVVHASPIWDWLNLQPPSSQHF